MKLSSIGNVSTTEGFKIDLAVTYKDALTAIGGFGHLIVIWWADKEDNSVSRKLLTTEKPYKSGPDNVGVFATRSPARPNPLCISIIDVREIDYEKGIIYTSYIDADHGTPVLDIKPYYPSFDVVKDVVMPEWCINLPTCMEDSADFEWSSYFNF